MLQPSTRHATQSRSGKPRSATACTRQTRSPMCLQPTGVTLIHFYLFRRRLNPSAPNPFGPGFAGQAQPPARHRTCNLVHRSWSSGAGGTHLKCRRSDREASFEEASSRTSLDIMTFAQTREYSPGIACTAPDTRRKFRLIFHFYGEPIGGRHDVALFSQHRSNRSWGDA